MVDGRRGTTERVHVFTGENPEHKCLFEDKTARRIKGTIAHKDDRDFCHDNGMPQAFTSSTQTKSSFACSSHRLESSELQPQVWMKNSFAFLMMEASGRS
ncbi:hypothetical protein PoB_002141000 [Plakobranchus ocellatus]|uniref:Uncharacterized protein n=1 Tax=Plakobranchus ocellatus TaxID=259542 RepID=A0AAV3ZIE8_9GAST|nr:hypothetical protein PoB_002141000 [Plakobranchus ocellatus]